MAEPRATILIRVSAGLKSRLLELAKRERRSLSKQVELLLERYVEISDFEGVAGDVSQKRQHRRSS
jgi:predicted DNA-binding protein